MRLSEFKDEEALDLLADIIEPVGSILEDDEIAKIYEDNKSDGFGIKAKLQTISVMIRNHKPEVIEILAKLNKKDVSEFHCNVLTLPKELLSLINDPIMQDFFASQVQNEGEISSAPVTENTEETEKN
jgi:hypothetical protein